MKVTITMKNPDALDEALADKEEEIRDTLGDDLDDDEKEFAIENRIGNARDEIKKWMRYGEYLDVEFNTDTGTATVLKAKD